ncbi:OmpA family protein [Halomonas heilongjiangensis]|uniref:Flagellar motor protein MotB n=1 Tax=Halomonas heilongjiangensis TaxID=1387883 RepID=A0A2N7TRH6_9GAMM|nr:OmpA family protein [Halomonas heilongjiangensis]PMR70786.1 flagellar motor protein MotB [Halomonas heilongjiangensis]PXX94006.1 flagellar motor protein MotB [Halomonas heilongjiangensis]
MKKSTTGLLLGSALVIGLSGCASSASQSSAGSSDRVWYQQPVVCGIAGALIGGSIGYATSGSSDEEDGAAIGGTAGAAIGALLCADRTPEPVAEPAPEPMPEPAPAPEPEFEPVVLSSEVNFEFDRAELRPQAEMTLDEVAHRLRENPNLRVRIEGHTDSVGSAEYNQGLSQRRAESVRNYLMSQGIAGDRMTATGYGEERPVATNDTDEGRALNRRVEIDRQ